MPKKGLKRRVNLFADRAAFVARTGTPVVTGPGPSVVPPPVSFAQPGPLIQPPAPGGSVSPIISDPSVNIGPDGITAGGTFGGVPVSVTIPVGGGGSPAIPGNLVASGGVATCPDGSFSVAGRCVDLIPGGSVSGGGMVLSTGEVVAGRYGAAVVPQAVNRTVRRCPDGMVLGDDGLCYKPSDLRKSDREWVPARKPLLTGGDLNAISKAARAARKIKSTTKRLEKLGMLKKPSRGRARLPRQTHSMRSLTPGVTVIDTE